MFPRPAHASSTVSPGRAPTASAATCEPSSCTDHAPSAKPGVAAACPRPATRIASGDTRPGSNGRLGSRRPQPLDPRVALFGPLHGSLDSQRHRGRIDAAAEKRAGSVGAERALERLAEPRRGRLTVASTRRRESAPSGARAAAACAATLRRTALANAPTRGPRASPTACTASLTAANAGTRMKNSWYAASVMQRAHVRVELPVPRGACCAICASSHGATRSVPYTSSVASARSRASRSAARVELGLQGRGRERVLLLDAHEHARGDVPGAAHRSGGRLTT